MGRISNEQETRIILAFKNGTKRSKIAEDEGISPKAVGNVLERNGLIERRKYNKTQKTESKKVCSKCAGVISITGAKYCPFCGNALRTKLEMALDDVYSASRIIVKTAPANDVDEFIRAWNVLAKMVKDVDPENSK